MQKITLVDNSRVSYSNPVRQSLFTFEDSTNTKDNYKALRAAESLRLIYPGVDAKGVILSIPMPGHHVGDSTKEKVRDEVKQLEELIREHDCIFLLMDTRESRWLPTLIGAANNKLVINSALGFDSFLVMRHGVKLSSEEEQEAAAAKKNQPEQLVYGSKIESHDLGCYFCNDIVAPGNVSHLHHILFEVYFD